MFEGKGIGGSMAAITVMLVTIAGTWGLVRFFEKKGIPLMFVKVALLITIAAIYLIGKYGFGLK